MADQQLKIDLTARDKTSAAFRSLNARLATTRKAAASVSAAIGKVTLAAGALGTGLFVATKKALNFADDIAKIADKVGVTTDALQEYRFAAELAGVKSDELDKALRKLQQSAGEATTKGTGTAADSFRLLGLEADLASGKLEDGVVRFRAVVNALSKVESQSQKSSIAAGIFGARLGPQMMNLLNQGIPAIDKAAERYKALGGTINESVLRASEQAVDALTELESILTKQLTNALVSTAPKIVEFGNRVVENMPKIISFLERMAELIGIIEKPIDVKIVALSKQIAEAQEKLVKAKRLAGGMGKVEAEKMIKALQNEIKDAEAKIAELQKKGAAAVQPMLAQKEASKTAASEAAAKTELMTSLAKQKEDEKFILDIKKAIAEVAAKEKEVIDQISESQRRAKQIAQSQVRLMNASNLEREKALKLEQTIYELQQAGVDLNSAKMKGLMEEIEANLDAEYQAKTILEEKLKVDEARNKAAERQKELQQQISDIMQDGIRTANEAISGLISGTMKWKDALGLVLRKVLDIVTTMNKGGKKGGGFNIGSLFKMGLSMFAASQGVPATPMGTSTGPMFPGLMDFHTGGVVGQGPRGFRSDERMILARTGERVLNRGQTAISSGGNGVVLNQTVNLTTGIQQTVRAEVMSMAPQIAAQAKAAVLDAKRRGGSYAAAFA